MPLPRGTRVAGKKAFITGAASGLGAAISRRLAEEGAMVVLTDRDLSGAREAASSIVRDFGPNVAHALHLDVTSERQWEEALAEANEAMGGISILVNNAGVHRGGDIETLSYADWKFVMAVNADSVFLGTKYALKHLRTSQPGSIINISSIAGLIAVHNEPAYNASKAASWLLSKGIALHCARQGLNIRCNSIHPTFIDTPFLDPFRESLGEEEARRRLARRIPLGRIGEPIDVADAALYLASDESKFVTGIELKVDGGTSAM